MKLDLNNEARKTVLFSKLVEKERQQLIVEKRNSTTSDLDENSVQVSDERQDEIASNVIVEYSKINTKLKQEKRALETMKEQRNKFLFTMHLNFDAYNQATKEVAVKEAYIKNLEEYIKLVFAEKFEGEI